MHHKNEVTKIIQSALVGSHRRVDIKRIHQLMDDYAEDQKSSWIDVNDRLPENQGYYLVYCPTSFPKNCRCVVAEFYEDNQTFYGEAFENAIDDGTHWMPLLNPPK